MYTSIPNGSSEAHSFIWQSLDHGNSFQMIPGQVGLGKPTSCPQGGGDTETAIDKKGDLFFSDLQNLSNLSNSVSTDHGATWTTNCLSVPNSPVDRMWYAIHGNLGDPDFAIYEEYDAAASGTNPNDPNAPTNQLVESVSHDGITFTPVLNSNLLAGKVDDNCIGGGQLNCVTDNEGISGNQVLARNGDLLIAHTTEDSNQVVVSRGKLTMEPGGQVVASWKHMVVNASLCPDKGSNPGTCGASNFATIAEDSAGHFYVAFSAQKTNSSGNAVGPYQTYIVASTDGDHWGKPMLVSRDGSNAFSWVNAGSSGRVAGTIHGPGAGPGAPYDSVADATGDDAYSANTQRTSAGTNLDLTGGRIRQDKNGLIVTMTAKSLSSLLPSATAGGVVGEWITRFTTYDPHTPGNGHIYYAGMESVAGGAPRFFGGDVAPTPGTGTGISMLFNSNTSIPGAVQGRTITLHVPWSMIGGHKTGRVLYSAIAFTATAASTLSQNPLGLFNLTDATPPFDYGVRR